MSWVELEETWIERSLLDFSVWVPVYPTGDQTCFLYAGGKAKVKHHIEKWLIESPYDNSIDENTRMRWVNASDHKQLLEIWEET